MRILLRLVRFSLKYKYRLLLAYVCTIGVTAFALAIPRILGTAVDEVVKSGEVAPLVFLAALILVISVLRGVAAYGQQYLGESLGQRVATTFATPSTNGCSVSASASTTTSAPAT